MGCGASGSCGTGCGKSGTGCSSGSCNRMNTYNWLSDIPISEFDTPYPIIEVSFNKGSRKEFFNNQKMQNLQKGDLVVVEGMGGIDIGEVSLTGEIVKLQYKKKGIRTKEEELQKVLRLPSEHEIKTFYENKKKEKEMLYKSRDIIFELNLKMKLAEVEIQADGKKATFFYTADDRIDFRELIKRLASAMNLRIEMKQIGIRQEAAKVGGIGSCGRELCCSSWLTDFKSVSTSAARYQNLSINQLKLSGQCGRLKCCLNFELDSYIDALKIFPKNADKLQTELGNAFLVKTDIFKNLMWYVYEGQSKFIPLNLEQVHEVLEMNKNKQKPAELKAVELVSTAKENLEFDAEFVDVVGQISLSSLDKNNQNRKKSKNKNKPNPNRPNPNNTNQNNANSNRPNPNNTNQNKPNPNNPNPNRPNPNRPNPNKANNATQRPNNTKPNNVAKSTPENNNTNSPNTTSTPNESANLENTNVKNNSDLGNKPRPQNQQKFQRNNNNRNKNSNPNTESKDIGKPKAEE